MEMSPVVSVAVLLVGTFDDQLDRYTCALQQAGAAVSHVVRVAELERWPRDQIVVCAASHATSWWKQVGASHVIVIGDGAARLAHADHILTPPVEPAQLVRAVLACQN
jgi:hypothetical protein